MITLFNGKVEFVEVEFRWEWMGHPKKSRQLLDRRQADILVDRGTVRIMDSRVEDDMGGKPKDRATRRIRKGKQMKAPAKDKMIKVAVAEKK